VQHYLFAYLKQANTNMQRLFDMFVTLRLQLSAAGTAVVVQGLCRPSCWLHTGVCGSTLQGRGLQGRILCTITTLYCFNAPGLRVQVRLSTGMCVIDASIGFVQHSLLAYTGVCATCDTSMPAADEHYNHVQPLLTQSCTAS
jgi:hypothetical protein